MSTWEDPDDPTGEVTGPHPVIQPQPAPVADPRAQVVRYLLGGGGGLVVLVPAFLAAWDAWDDSQARIVALEAQVAELKVAVEDTQTVICMVAASDGLTIPSCVRAGIRPE